MQVPDDRGVVIPFPTEIKDLYPLRPIQSYTHLTPAAIFPRGTTAEA